MTGRTMEAAELPGALEPKKSSKSREALSVRYIFHHLSKLFLQYSHPDSEKRPSLGQWPRYGRFFVYRLSRDADLTIFVSAFFSLTVYHSLRRFLIVTPNAANIDTPKNTPALPIVLLQPPCAGVLILEGLVTSLVITSVMSSSLSG